MARHDAVLGAGRGHPDAFLRARVCGDKSQAGDPRWNRPAREEEILAAANDSSQCPADAEHEDEVDDQDRIVDPAEVDLWQLVRPLRLDHDDAVRPAPLVTENMPNLRSSRDLVDVRLARRDRGQGRLLRTSA